MFGLTFLGPGDNAAPLHNEKEKGFFCLWYSVHLVQCAVRVIMDRVTWCVCMCVRVFLCALVSVHVCACVHVCIRK